MPISAPVLCITICVSDDEDTMVFCSCVFHKKIRYHMYFIPMDLRKCDLLVIIPLYFRECDLLIVNMLFWWKPDDSGRKLMTKNSYSPRNVVMKQMRGGPHKLDLLVET